MKKVLVPICLLLGLQACHKPDESSPVINSPLTDKIKTVEIQPLNAADAWQRSIYRFTYTQSGLVDTMQLSANSGIYNTYVYERHPTYFIRRLYNGPMLRLDPSVDSFGTETNGRILNRKAYSSYIGRNLLNTVFEYGSDQKMIGWTSDFPDYPGIQDRSSIAWTSGNVTYAEGMGGDMHTGEFVGNYTYDATKPGQPAHPITFYALYEWGQPLVQCNQAFATHDFDGDQKLTQNIVWSGNRITSYESLDERQRMARFTFTYY